MSKNHIIIYSHGFGVRKDDRGLFTDIAASFPGITHVMFDYNQVDEVANTLTVASLTKQAEQLQQIVAETRVSNPNAVIDLICHSQGCLVAAIAQPEGIRKAIFTAPPPDADIEDRMRRWKVRYGTQLTTEGTSYLERKDGSTTIVPPEYWTSLKDLNAQELYNTLAKITELIIITAAQDEVLGEVVFGELSSNIKVIEMATGHNFEGEGRQQLIKVISSELSFKREVPAIIRKVGLDISWDERKVWPLDYPVEEMSVSELVWHYEIPFWFKSGGFYDLKPQEVVDNPEQYADEYARTMHADISHPIDVMFWRGRWLILDGLHRLLKQTLQGAQTVKVRKIPESEKQRIMKDKVSS